MDGAGDHHVKQNKPDSKDNYYMLSLVYGIWIKKTKDVKVDRGLFEDEERDQQEGRGQRTRKSNGGVNMNKVYLYTCMKMSY
jgi:hypothetical protein